MEEEEKQIVANSRVFYAGIGSRSTPPQILKKMTDYAERLERLGFVLRSGGAKGADKAFEAGVKSKKNKEIFVSDDARKHPWSYDMAEKYLPNDRSNFKSWNPYVKGLLARNMMQVFGVDGKTPISFIVCWTPSEDYESSAAGGTGYAIRAALDRKIKVFNLFSDAQRAEFEIILEELEK